MNFKLRPLTCLSHCTGRKRRGVSRPQRRVRVPPCAAPPCKWRRWGGKGMDVSVLSLSVDSNVVSTTATDLNVLLLVSLDMVQGLTVGCTYLTKVSFIANNKGSVKSYERPIFLLCRYACCPPVSDVQARLNRWLVN